MVAEDEITRSYYDLIILVVLILNVLYFLLGDDRVATAAWPLGVSIGCLSVVHLPRHPVLLLLYHY